MRVTMNPTDSLNLEFSPKQATGTVTKLVVTFEAAQGKEFVRVAVVKQGETPVQVETWGLAVLA